jgi:hypothetical protein
MQSVKSFEQSIQDLEGFSVRVCRHGRKVRGDRKIAYEYTYKRSAKGDFTVSQFLRNRTNIDDDMYLEVLNNDGHKVHGRTKLSTVRASYQ